jgi:hypothetical protein
MTPGASAEAAQGALSQAAEVAPAIAEAGMIGAMSALRYWQALAEIHAKYQASLMQAVVDRAGGRAAASPAECRVLADEVRAYLREIGEAANQEARRLQSELEQIGESIAQKIEPHDPSHPHRRQHRVKE